MFEARVTLQEGGDISRMTRIGANARLNLDALRSFTEQLHSFPTSLNYNHHTVSLMIGTIQIEKDFTQ
jgi:hypothetical protein